MCMETKRHETGIQWPLQEIKKECERERERERGWKDRQGNLEDHCKMMGKNTLKTFAFHNSGFKKLSFAHPLAKKAISDLWKKKKSFFWMESFQLNRKYA